jgi:hypothetical protein
MGKHFDTLVEATRTNIPAGKSSEMIKDYKSYLERIIEESALFELQIDPKDILNISGKKLDEYISYMRDYLDMSAKYGEHIITPFNITAIEDKISAVIMEKLGGNNYMFTICNRSETPGFENTLNIVTGNAKIFPVKNKMAVSANAEFYIYIDEKDILFNSPLIRDEALLDLGTAVNAYFQELVYIMDPENFIVQKESNQSRQIRERKEKNGGKRKKLDKTIMRPHYICLSENDLRDFMRSESKEPRAAHPVRGHMRKLMSEKYVNKRGQRVYIKQYFTGEGSITGVNGWNYQVYVKEAPNILVQYK